MRFVRYFLCYDYDVKRRYMKKQSGSRFFLLPVIFL
nr:MAG TPA: hypothetical protein [Caudoviricetes sp.]